MKNIFVSYNQADRERVRRIVRLFEERGWSVYWDRNTQPGDPWDRLLERCLDTAQCVVAVWSSASVESDWVRAEVRRAKAQNKVVPCRIDRDAEIPLEFSGVHAANLVGFPDTHDPTQQDNLLTRVAELIGKRPALSSLREAYLNRVLRENNQLALGGIDPKAAGERQASLELGAVYTALLTLSAQERETEGTGVEHSRALAARETRRRSALEAVKRSPTAGPQGRRREREVDVRPGADGLPGGRGAGQERRQPRAPQSAAA